MLIIMLQIHRLDIMRGCIKSSRARHSVQRTPMENLFQNLNSLIDKTLK